MKTQIHITIGIIAAISLIGAQSLASGLPEPGLVMYGAVRNAAVGNTRLTAGTLTWTVTPPSGPSVVITTALSDIGGQYSYLLRVPFESIVGSATPSANVLQLNSAITSYYRTNVTFTFGSNTYPATIATTNLGYFTFSTGDRGKTEAVDLAVNAPGVGAQVVITNPTFGTSKVLPDGRFQLMVSGTPGQSYSLLASTNLINWTPISVFVCTNSPMAIYDPTASNYVRRFYRLGPTNVTAQGQLALVPPTLGLTSLPLSSGGPTLMLSGSSGVNYRVEASTDLVHWTTITNVSSTSITTYLKDPAATNYPRRFYRAATP